MDEEVNPNDEAVLRMLAGARFGPNAGVVLPSGRRLTAGEAQALTSFYAPARGERPPSAERLIVDHERPGEDSPIRLYLAGGGDLGSAPPRTREILRLAEESYRRRSTAPAASPEPPAGPAQRRRWWQRKP